jgi:hypothetical protein
MKAQTNEIPSSSEYRRLSHKAAHLERTGLFAMAHPLWAAAAKHATSTHNQLWAQRRAETCEVLNIKSLSSKTTPATSLFNMMDASLSLASLVTKQTHSLRQDHDMGT